MLHVLWQVDLGCKLWAKATYVAVRRIESMLKYTLDCTLTLSLKRQILDASKLKEFPDDNFRFAEHSRKFSKWVENTVGKGEIARSEQFLLFLQCFQKTCTEDMEKPGFVWGRLKGQILLIK